MTNRVLSADEALSWGLVNQIFDPKVLLEKTIEVAESLAKGPTLSFGGIKKLVHHSFTSSLEGQMELETQMISESSKTFDGKEGIKSFLQKKEPNFLGK